MKDAIVIRFLVIHPSHFENLLFPLELFKVLNNYHYSFINQPLLPVPELQYTLCFIAIVVQEGPSLKSKGMVGNLTRVAVLTWRSLLIMSREWKYYWLRLILYMLLALCIGTVFSGLGHTLSSVVVS